MIANFYNRWECDSKGDTSTSIPYQLQHLFLLLQTSSKQSVETTGLTKSFGWDSSEGSDVILSVVGGLLCFKLGKALKCISIGIISKTSL